MARARSLFLASAVACSIAAPQVSAASPEGSASTAVSSAPTSVYPSPPPDFAHPDSPHAPQFSRAGGDNDRPVLVILERFTDLATPAGKTAAYYRSVFFGAGFGSVADYFRASSFGKLLFTPAAETHGTANDGIVIVNLGSSASFMSQNDPTRGRLIVAAADPFVDYSSFDRNDDGTITNDELIIAAVRVSYTANCGGTRAIAAGPALDGMDLEVANKYSETTTLTDRITIAHEISHQALDVQDFDYVEGSLDLHGTTCGFADDAWWDYNSWKKLHFGWIAPIVVVRDGFYPIGRSDLTGQAYILYDPGKGTKNYFVVENRRRTPGTYDKDASDSGLVIWRLDEKQYATGPIDLMSPTAGAGREAWDPSDPRTPQRVMARGWKDGTLSGLAVRAIGDRGTTMWAYFDVRGPGVMVDAYGLGAVRATPGVARTVTFPVRNTGQATDTFDITLSALPSGWTATTVRRQLVAGGEANVSVELHVPPGTAARTYAIKAAGHSVASPSIASASGFRVAIGTTGDFDGDRRTDTAVWRPSTGDWWIVDSSTNANEHRPWGVSGDVPVPADYDADGKTDTAVWRPSTRDWWIVNSSTSVSSQRHWGEDGDVPVPGDYDGDGRADTAVWRPATQDWWIVRSSNGANVRRHWGESGDVPVPGDYDGDGKTDIATWRPSTGDWWLLLTTTGHSSKRHWGVDGDATVPADYDGDGRTDTAIWRPSTGVWWIVLSSTAANVSKPWGTTGDRPRPGDYDRDGKADTVVWRPSTQDWWIVLSSNGTNIQRHWGASGDVPVS